MKNRPKRMRLPEERLRSLWQVHKAGIIAIFAFATTVVGIVAMVAALWPSPQETVELTTGQKPAIVQRMPTPTPTPTPTLSYAPPRLTEIEQQEIAETRSVPPTTWKSRPPVASATTKPTPQETAKSVPTVAPQQTVAPTPTVSTPEAVVTPAPSDPTYTETPVWVNAICGRNKDGLTAIASFPVEQAGTPVICQVTDNPQELRWVPLEPNGPIL